MSNDPLKSWRNKLPEQFLHWSEGKHIEEVECIVPDMAGISRGKAIPTAKFAKGTSTYLPNSIFYQTITGGYAELNDMENQWIERDMLLIPCLETACCTPWAQDPTLQIIHDLHTSTGALVELAPRTVLARVMKAYHDRGLEPIVGPEMEFYLTKPNVDPKDPIEPPLGRTGRQGMGRQVYSMAAVDEYGKVVDDIYEFADAQGFSIESVIQEGGAGQIEINLAHNNPMALADQIFYFKRSIREAALQNSYFATFMAKPMRDQPGSAMHIHHSVKDRKNGQNIFKNNDDSESESFYYYLGGMQRYLPSVVAILAPYVNSYRRFDADNSAPANVEWSRDNRTTGLRIPVSDPHNRRIENRIVGMDCNPYLALAASLACGLLGLENKIDPREPKLADAYSDGISLPITLNAALENFTREPELYTLLGENFCKVYKEIKQTELSEFLSEISPWEREHLLLNV